MAATAPARAPRRTPRTAPRGPSRPGRAKPRRRTPASRAITPPAGLIPAAVNRVGDIADSGLMQRLTRSRAWIAVLGLLLGGIVTVNVLSLSYSAAGGKIAAKSEALTLRNAELRAQLTKDMAGPRIEAVAIAHGLVVPEARDIRYLTAGERFAALAARRIEEGTLTSGAVAEASVEPAAPVEPVVPVEEPVPVEPTAEPVVPATAPTDPAVPAPTVTP
jgi:hypothetical protein